RRTVFGESHPETAQSMHNVGWLCAKQGMASVGDEAKAAEHFQEAGPLLEKALEIRETVLGDIHPETAQSKNSYGTWLGVHGRGDEAESLLLEALETRRKVLGDSHLDTADTLYELGSLYARQGDYQRAKPLLEESMVIRGRVLGENNPVVAAAKTDYQKLLSAIL